VYGSDIRIDDILGTWVMIKSYDLKTQQTEMAQIAVVYEFSKEGTAIVTAFDSPSKYPFRLSKRTLSFGGSEYEIKEVMAESMVFSFQNSLIYLDRVAKQETPPVTVKSISDLVDVSSQKVVTCTDGKSAILLALNSGSKICIQESLVIVDCKPATDWTIQQAGEYYCKNY